jgi:hypothetical protein
MSEKQINVLLEELEPVLETIISGRFREIDGVFLV